MKIYFQFHFFAIRSISASIWSIIAWKVSASSWSPSEFAMFFNIDPRILGRSVNFKILKGFLCRRPVFLDYLSVSYDYDVTTLPGLVVIGFVVVGIKYF